VHLAPGEPFLAKPFSIAALQRTVRAAHNYGPPSSPRGPLSPHRRAWLRALDVAPLRADPLTNQGTQGDHGHGPPPRSWRLTW
jgi:hypothetical protein